MLAGIYIVIFFSLYTIIFGFLGFHKRKSPLLLNSIFIILFILYDIYRYHIFGFSPVRIYDSFLGLSLIVIVFLYITNGFKSKQAWTSIIVSLLALKFIIQISTEFMFRLVDISLWNIRIYGVYSFVSVLLGLGMTLILNLLSFLLKFKLDINAIGKLEVSLILLFLLPFAYFITAVYEYFIQFEFTLGGLLLGFVSLLSGLIGVLFVLYLATYKSHVKDIEEREDQQIKLFDEQVQNYQRLIERNQELIEFKHNVVNELTYALGLLDNNKNEETKNYLINMNDFFANLDIKTGQSTGCSVTNASWFSLINNEKFKDIAHSWKGTLPEDLFIETRDAVLLFSNLLDNAFEAAFKSVNKFVRVEVTRDHDTYSIKIINSYDGDIKYSFDGNFLTTKSDKANHGIGSKIVKKISAKYGSIIDISYHLENDNEFEVIVIITPSINL